MVGFQSGPGGICVQSGLQDSAGAAEPILHDKTKGSSPKSLLGAPCEFISVENHTSYLHQCMRLRKSL